MRYKDMARHFLLEAGIKAARGLDTSVGLELGDDRQELTPGQLAKFRDALRKEIKRQVTQLEGDGVIVQGTVLPADL